MGKLFGGLIALIGFVATVGSAFVFITGYDSLPDFLHNIDRNPALVSDRPVSINARINQVTLDRFEILSRREPGSTDPIYAIEPGFFLRPRHLVQLNCSGNDCTGTRLAPLGSLESATSLAVRVDGPRVLLMDYMSSGVFYDGELSRYSKFSLLLPCVTHGFERLDFSNRILDMVVHASNCAGHINIGAFSTPVARPQRQPGMNEAAYFKYHLRVEFNEFGGIADGLAEIQRLHIGSTRPSWYVTGFSPRVLAPLAPDAAPSRARTALLRALDPHRSNRLHVADQMSEVSWSDAMTACEVERNTLVAFMDGSINHDGFIGVCFLERGILARNALQEPRFISYESMQQTPPRVTGASLIVEEVGQVVGIEYTGTGPGPAGRLLTLAANAALSADDIYLTAAPAPVTP